MGDKIITASPVVIPFKEALHGRTCSCGKDLQWRLASKDPNDPRWHAECCGRWYWLAVHCVKAWSTEAA